MKYMLIIYNGEAADGTATPEQMRQLFGGYMAFTESIKQKGIYIAGDPLQPTATATTVRQAAKAGAVTTDGPYAETKEQLGAATSSIAPTSTRRWPARNRFARCILSRASRWR